MVVVISKKSVKKNKMFKTKPAHIQIKYPAKLYITISHLVNMDEEQS